MTRFIQSMTAFSRQELPMELGTLTWEIRSVNHRYLEINLRLPELFRAFEASIRDYLGKQISRGKIEAYLSFIPNVNSNHIQINETLVKELMVTSQQITQFFTESTPLRVIDILKWPGVVATAEMDKDFVQQKVMNLLEVSVTELIKNRQREGEALKQCLIQRLAAVQVQINQIKQRIPEITLQVHKKLQQRVAVLKLDCEQSRLEQEIALQLQKMDVAEELDRLSAHIIEAQRVLEQGGTAGRRLDFLLQEFNREANTLGAKSIDTEMTNGSVELKVLIEQMREQVQNIE